jgi:hypothetical protein
MLHARIAGPGMPLGKGFSGAARFAAFSVHWRPDLAGRDDGF